MTAPMPDTPTVSVEECSRALNHVAGFDSIATITIEQARSAASHLRSLVEENKRLREKNEELKRYLDIHHQDDSDMAESMNAVIDANGGWVEEGEGTYAANFARIIASLKARLDAAEAIVAKLPKTADGVPVTVGSIVYCHDTKLIGRVWCSNLNHYHVQWSEDCGGYTAVGPRSWAASNDVEKSFSTREAANATIAGDAK